MPDEKANADVKFFAEVIRGGRAEEAARAGGKYFFECYGPDGKLKWRDECHNTVTTVGKNYALTVFLSGSGFTIVGPWLGLIGAVTTGTNAADTMGSHSGWVEAGAANPPTYSGSRKNMTTVGWAAASNGQKALSTAASFNITGTGTVNGAFVALDSGALTTIDNTGGTLYSAGTFTAKAVGNGDTLNVSWTGSL